MPCNLMKAPQGCLGILQATSTTRGLLFLTRGGLPQCSVIGLEEPVGKRGLGARVAIGFRAQQVILLVNYSLWS